MGTKLQVITLKQLPIIEEHLQLVKADVETRTKNAMQLVCTEETRGDVKKIRTELGKEFASMEEQRKRVKEAIMEPYNQFEAVYNRGNGLRIPACVLRQTAVLRKQKKIFLAFGQEKRVTVGTLSSGIMNMLETIKRVHYSP